MDLGVSQRPHNAEGRPMRQVGLAQQVGLREGLSLQRLDQVLALLHVRPSGLHGRGGSRVGQRRLHGFQQGDHRGHAHAHVRRPGITLRLAEALEQGGQADPLREQRQFQDAGCDALHEQSELTASGGSPTRPDHAGL